MSLQTLIAPNMKLFKKIQLPIKDLPFKMLPSSTKDSRIHYY